MNERIFNVLRCPQCGGMVTVHSSASICASCQASFPHEEDVLRLLVAPRQAIPESTERNLIFFIKEFFKKYPRVYLLLMNVFGASLTGTSAKVFYRKNCQPDMMVLSLGSGIKSIVPGIIKLDMEHYAGVDVIADICNLPFRDSSIDAVICEDVLEHVRDPRLAVREMHRVLKQGGKVFLSVPFIFQFHSSPNDFYRWTNNGVKELMGAFQQEELGIKHGPTSAFVVVLASWLAVLLSFGVQKLHDVLFIAFTIMLAPWCHLVDWLLVRFKTAENMNAGFYFIGRKV